MSNKILLETQKKFTVNPKITPSCESKLHRNRGRAGKMRNIPVRCTSAYIVLHPVCYLGYRHNFVVII